MIFLGWRIDQEVINDDNKLVQELHELIVHKVQQIGGVRVSPIGTSLGLVSNSIVVAQLSQGLVRLKG